MPETLLTFETPVISDWVDFNGHLRDGFYMVLFSYGVDGLMDQIGLDAGGRQATGHSIFTLEAHVNFLHEVKLGAQVQVYCQVLGHDAKRLHVGLALHLKGDNAVMAYSEQMLLNVAMDGPRASPFVPNVAARVQMLATAQRSLPRPPYVGRVISLPAAKTA
jgi:acyl-CoA thioester hydrolase